jgi:hypothetical protein
VARRRVRAAFDRARPSACSKRPRSRVVSRDVAGKGATVRPPPPAEFRHAVPIYSRRSRTRAFLAACRGVTVKVGKARRRPRSTACGVGKSANCSVCSPKRCNEQQDTTVRVLDGGLSHPRRQSVGRIDCGTRQRSGRVFRRVNLSAHVPHAWPAPFPDQGLLKRLRAMGACLSEPRRAG